MNTPVLAQKIEGPFLILGAIIVLTVGFSLLPASWFGIQPSVAHYEPLNLGALAESETGASDVDGDGTVSWKEYIASSLGIPEDDATTTIAVDPRELAALNDPNNLTSSFTKNLYVASVALNQSGVDDPNTDQETITQLVQKEAQKVHPASYTEASVKVSSDASPAALKTYANTIAPILTSFITKASITSDLTSVTKYSQSEDEADLLPLVKNNIRTQKLLDTLLSVQVPKQVVATHLEVLNRVAKYAATLDNLSHASDDPLRATIAIKSYSDDAVDALRSIPLLSDYFTKANVVFSAKDAGYVFITGYTGN
jgi:hypothetical protein